jgi:hypothetical protein
MHIFVSYSARPMEELAPDRWATLKEMALLGVRSPYSRRVYGSAMENGGTGMRTLLSLVCRF